MNNKEFSIFANLLRTAYPKEKILPNREAVELWYRLLADIPYHAADLFLQKWVATHPFSPAISEIREGVALFSGNSVPDWGMGWKEVLAAIGKYGYMNERKALESLSPVTRSAVERLGWQNICLSEEEGVIRAGFRQCFEAAAKQAREELQIPARLKKAIEELGGRDDYKRLSSGAAESERNDSALSGVRCGVRHAV